MNYPQGANEDPSAPWNEIYQPPEMLTVEVDVYYELDEDEDCFQTVEFTVELENKRADIAREAQDWCRRKGLVYVDWFLSNT